MVLDIKEPKFISINYDLRLPAKFVYPSIERDIEKSVLLSITGKRLIGLRRVFL